MLPKDIREKAMAGDLVALEKLGDQSTRLLVLGRPSESYRPAVDIVLHNLRPEIRPQTAFTSKKETHRNWLKSTLLSFRILSLLAQYDEAAIELQSKSSFLTPHLRIRWSSHIVPCLSSIIDRYILDDFQRSIDPPMYNQDSAFLCVTALIHDFGKKPWFDPKNSLPGSGKDLAAQFTRLFVRYLARYTTFDVQLSSFGWLIKGPTVQAGLDKAPPIVPLLATWFRQEAQMHSSTKDAMKIMKTLGTIQTIGELCPSVLEDLVRDHHDLMECALQIWSRYLCVSGEHARAIPRIMRRGCVSDLIFFVLNVLLRGGADTYRQAIRNGLLRLIFMTINDTVDHNRFAPLLCAIIKNLQSFLALYSVLSPFAHAVDELDKTKQGFLTREKRVHLLEMKVTWNELRTSLETQRPVLKQYREEVLAKGPALCLCANVCR